MSIEDKINLLWEGSVKNLSFNIPMHRLSFSVEKYIKNKKEIFHVEISEISFYIFYDKYAYTVKNFNWEVTELSTFFYAPKKIVSPKILSQSYNEGKKFNINYNLSLELWEADILIQANKLKINDDLFDLNTGQLIT